MNISWCFFSAVRNNKLAARYTLNCENRTWRKYYAKVKDLNLKTLGKFSEIGVQRCAIKDVFVKNWQSSRKNTCNDFLFSPWSAMLLKNTSSHVFSCEFCKIFKNNYWIERLQRLLLRFSFFHPGIPEELYLYWDILERSYLRCSI